MHGGVTATDPEQDAQRWIGRVEIVDGGVKLGGECSVDGELLVGVDGRLADVQMGAEVRRDVGGEEGIADLNVVRG